MQVRDLPRFPRLSQNQGSAIDEPTVQLERHDSRIADDLDPQVAWLEIHIFLFHDHLRSRDAVDAHIRAQNFRNDDGTVGLLVILHHSNPCAANRQARAV
jgi:hypothetical protein